MLLVDGTVQLLAACIRLAPGPQFTWKLNEHRGQVAGSCTQAAVLLPDSAPRVDAQANLQEMVTQGHLQPLRGILPDPTQSVFSQCGLPVVVTAHVMISK